jgi:two-component system CheB/CheR fusion protein
VPNVLLIIRVSMRRGLYLLRHLAITWDVARARRLRQEFEAELQHRTRNLLGLVQAMVPHALDDADEAAAFKSRLAALGRVQGLQTSAEAKLNFRELICTEIEAHGAANEQVTIEGEPVAFPRAKAEMLALAVHELATSARKHGALSLPGGGLSVRWHTHGSGGDHLLTFCWEETCAHAAHAIDLREGYDRELLERALPYAFGATTKLEIRAEGVRCQIDIPLTEFVGPSSPLGSSSSPGRPSSHNHFIRAVNKPKELRHLTAS